MRARLSALVQREFLRVRPKGVPSGRRKTAVAVRHFCWRPPAQVMRPSSQSPSTRSHSMSTGPSHGTAGAALGVVDAEAEGAAQVVLTVGADEACGGEGGDAVAEVVHEDAAAVAEPHEVGVGLWRRGLRHRGLLRRDGDGGRRGGGEGRIAPQEGLHALGFGQADLAPKDVGPLAPEVAPELHLAFRRRALLGKQTAHGFHLGGKAGAEEHHNRPFAT